MELTLILVGAGCMIAAVVGGGIKLSQLEIRKFASVARQVILFVLGLVLLIIGLAKEIRSPDSQGAKADSASSQAQTAKDAATVESPSGSSAAAGAPPATESDNGDGDEVAAETRAAPAGNVTGNWTNLSGEVHHFEQRGNRLTVTADTTVGRLTGSGTIEGNSIKWNAGPMNCEGSYNPSVPIIVATCLGPGGTIALTIVPKAG